MFNHHFIFKIILALCKMNLAPRLLYSTGDISDSRIPIEKDLFESIKKEIQDNWNFGESRGMTGFDSNAYFFKRENLAKISEYGPLKEITLISTNEEKLEKLVTGLRLSYDPEKIRFKS